MMKPFVELEPLKIRCTDSDCDNDLHCLKGDLYAKVCQNLTGE